MQLLKTIPVAVWYLLLAVIMLNIAAVGLLGIYGAIGLSGLWFIALAVMDIKAGASGAGGR